MRFLITATLIVLLAFCAAPNQSAYAQEGPKTLMELLFPRNNNDVKAKTAKPKAQPQKARNRTTTKRARTSENTTPQGLIASPLVAAPEKSPNAKKILVVGDFLATGVASGLTATFEFSADVAVTDASNGSSGLVRDDFYNWPTEIGALISAQQPAIVVVMLGANDRQQLTISGQREEVRSPAWLIAYKARVNALAQAVTSRNIPLVWIGQVPFRSQAMTADMLTLNDIFREAADKGNPSSAFVDVWEGFVDETGKFVERGPDVNGQNVALRSGQINITKAGYRKIAFYAERTLNRLLGATVSPGQNQLEEASLPPLSIGPQGVDPNLERLAPIDLLGTGSAANDALLGATVQPAKRNSPLAGPVPAGRIDDLKIKP